MPRKKYIAQSQFPYHLTNRCNNREWFDVPLGTVWRIFCDQILDSSDRYRVILNSFVLMSNHFHLMVVTPQSNLDCFLRHMLTEVSRKLKRESNRVNHIFGGRTKQTILETPQSVAYVYKYVYRNPVRAAICSKAEEYAFSTLSRLLTAEPSIPIAEGLDDLWTLIPRETKERLDWLNVPTPKEQEHLVSRALRRSSFAFSKSNSVRKTLELLSKSYGVETKSVPYNLSPLGE